MHCKNTAWIKNTLIALMTCILSLTLSLPALAHFGMVIPSDSMVMSTDDRTLTLALAFSHPFEGHGMNLDKPAAFQVTGPGGTADLLPALTPLKIMAHGGWTAAFPVRRPGVYAFVMTPEPYWEPAEDCFIVHYTKTVVAAFGAEEGWNRELGLKTEIVPLTRPFGLYAGNLFQGVVKRDGLPVPGAEVEVEFYNRDRNVQAPSDYMVTQVVQADPNGVFSYAAPAAGWWGFAALTTSNEKMDHEGTLKDVELGAVIWVEFMNWQGK